MKKNLLFFLVLLILIIPSFKSLLRPGYFPMQDDMQAFRLMEMNKCITDGQIPCRWVPDAGYGYGYPQFNFYAPFVYYVGEVIHLTGFQYIDSIKILFILGFVLGGVFMYLLTSELFGPFPALVSSVLFTYIPLRAQEVYVRGALSEFWATVFFPLILWAFLKLVKEGKKRYLIISAVSLGGLFLTHNLLSFLFLPIVVLWLVYLFFAYKKTFNWKKIILSFLLALGTAAFFVLPMLLEKKFAHTETMLGGYFDYRQHFVSLKQLFLSNYWGYGSSTLGPNDDLNLSVGIPYWIFGVISVITAFIYRKKEKKLFWLSLVSFVLSLIILFLVHEKSSFIWKVITPLSYLQFPWRLLIFPSFIFSVLAGVVLTYFKKFQYPAGVLIIISLFLLQLGFFQPKAWLKINDEEKLTGINLEKELTASIFDYLPIYAKFPPEKKAPDLPEILSGRAEFSDYYKGSNYQTGKLEVSSDALIRLPLFDFPGMKVFLNNEEVKHANNNCEGEKFCSGTITFMAQSGEYDFKVKLTDTPIRTAGNIVSVVSVLFLIVFGFFKNEKLFKEK
jgi:uncharacterized membrane protein